MFLTHIYFILFLCLKTTHLILFINLCVIHGKCNGYKILTNIIKMINIFFLKKIFHILSNKNENIKETCNIH